MRALGLVLAAGFAQGTEPSIDGWTLARLRTVLRAPDASARDRCEAVTLLARLGPLAAPAIPELVNELRREDACDGARSALRQIGPTSIPVFASLLEDEDTRLALGSAMALGSMGPAAISALVGVSRSGSERARSLVSAPLARIGTQHPLVLSTLMRLAVDPSARVRRSAVQELGRLEEPTSDVIDCLRLAVQDSDPEVAQEAVAGLARILTRRPKK